MARQSYRLTETIMEDLYSDENPPPTPQDAHIQLGDIIALGSLIFVILVFFGSGLYLWVDQ